MDEKINKNLREELTLINNKKKGKETSCQYENKARKNMVKVITKLWVKFISISIREDFYRFSQGFHQVEVDLGIN